MKFDFKELTIKKQLLILFILFVVLAVTSFITINHFRSRIDDVRQQVEVAKQLPEWTGNISLALENVSANDELAKKELQKNASKIDNHLTTFLKGGILPNHDIYVAPADGELKLRLEHADVLWDSLISNINVLRFDPYELDTAIQEVIEVPNNDSLNTTRTEIVSKMITIDNPVVVKAKSFTSENIDDFKTRIIGVNERLEKRLESAQNSLDYVIIIVVIFNLIVLSLLLWGIRKVILEQINQLDEITDKLSHGHFDVETHFSWKNEISKVAANINQLATSLKNATDFVKEVGKGELDKEFKGIDKENINENSLEAALLNMRDQMKQVEEEEEIRNWSTGGLTKFVDILRSSNDDVKELSDQIISNLVDYTHSNQGGLYLLNEENEEDKKLELISLYAFDTKKYDQKSYRLGEGLVGQTFLERKTTYLLEVPNDYIEITSGLGGSNPKAILVVPLQVNEEIFGILELASFEEYKDYEIEFVEKLGESIASTIASVRNNQKTKRLLEESQELTEQMQAQEEEMRQNMEELSATQEEMARKEIEITAQLTAINNSLGTIEYDTDGLITNTNDIFDENMGFHQGELYEKAFVTIFNDDHNVWSLLTEGNSQTGNFNFKKKGGEEIILESSFTPIKNDEGEVYKIIQLVTSFGQTQSAPVTEKDDELSEVETALRQNLEELEITQEQLDAKLTFAQQKIQLVDQHISILTLDQQLVIADANQAATTFLGQDQSDIKGKNISLLTGDEVESAIANKEPEVEVNLTDSGGKSTLKKLSLVYQKSEKETDVTYILWV